MNGVESIGCFNVTKMNNGQYIVETKDKSVPPYVVDEAGLKAFKEKCELGADKTEFTNKNHDCKAKKSKGGFWKGFASWMCPGLGQAIDGRFKDGAKFYGKALGLGFAGGVVGLAGYANFVKTVEAAAKTGVSKTPYGFYASIVAVGALGIAAIVNHVKSVVDAYKGGKH